MLLESIEEHEHRNERLLPLTKSGFTADAARRAADQASLERSEGLRRPAEVRAQPCANARPRALPSGPHAHHSSVRCHRTARYRKLTAIPIENVRKPGYRRARARAICGRKDVLEEALDVGRREPGRRVCRVLKQPMSESGGMTSGRCCWRAKRKNHARARTAKHTQERRARVRARIA